MRSETFLVTLSDAILSGEVKEEPKGSNRGPVIDEILTVSGAAKGSPWCGAFLFWGAMKTTLYAKTALPGNPAAVYSWVSFFKKKNRVSSDISKVARGDLGFWLNEDLHGHIFAINEIKKVPVVSKLFPAMGTWLRCSEGNTSDNPEDREGWKAVKRWRRYNAKKHQFILFRDY